MDEFLHSFHPKKSDREKRKEERVNEFISKKKKLELESKIENILCIVNDDRSQNDFFLLEKHPDIVSEIQERLLQRKKRKEMNLSRSLEIEDSQNEIVQKLSKLCELIKEACDHRDSLKKNVLDSKMHNIVLHCGAGLSTSVGVLDFRSPGGIYSQVKVKKGQKRSNAYLTHPYEQYKPSVSHMIISALVRTGIVDHVISQNIDGLHLRSGLDPTKLIELHGNVFKEKCTKCEKQFWRRYNVAYANGTSFRRHFTGRFCENQKITHNVEEDYENCVSLNNLSEAILNEGVKPKAIDFDEKGKCERRGRGGCDGMGNGEDRKGREGEGEGEGERRENELEGGERIGVCGGKLHDTIIHFGEALNKIDLENAKSISKNSLLAICLGSSLKVPPACNLPRLAKKVVIVNLQWTQLDKIADLKINSRLDKVMTHLATSLNIPVPKYDAKADPILMQDAE